MSWGTSSQKGRSTPPPPPLCFSRGFPVVFFGMNGDAGQPRRHTAMIQPFLFRVRIQFCHWVPRPPFLFFHWGQSDPLEAPLPLVVIEMTGRVGATPRPLTSAPQKASAGGRPSLSGLSSNIYCGGLCSPSVTHTFLHCLPITSHQSPVCAPRPPQGGDRRVLWGEISRGKGNCANPVCVRDRCMYPPRLE